MYLFDSTYYLSTGTSNLNALTLAGNLVAAQVNTGQGLTEVHLMNQNVRTSDNVTFANITGNNFILPQNPVGTTYGNGVSTTPPYMISQTVGDNDGWRLYGETSATNAVRMVFELVDDIETAFTDQWVFRNKQTYSSYTARNEFQISGNGDALARTSMRAPIFYDSDNTAYYIDGASTSDLNALKVNALYLDRSEAAARGISFYSPSYTSWAMYMSPAGAGGSGPTGNITAPSGNIVTSWALRSFIENAGGYGWTFESGTSSGQPSVVAEIRSSDGQARFNGGVLSPIFYDSNNTNYYGDFASTSRFNRADLNDTRSDIFYDRNNTGYYGDFASTSVLNNLNVQGTLTVNGTINLGNDYQIGDYKYFAINNLGASATQARRFEIARIGIDFNDWNSVGLFEV
jgi:hypothetical protein